MTAERRARAIWEGTILEGLDRAAFEEAARAGEEGCRPISNAIRGNVGIRLTAELEG